MGNNVGASILALGGIGLGATYALFKYTRAENNGGVRTTESPTRLSGSEDTVADSYMGFLTKSWTEKDFDFTTVAPECKSHALEGSAYRIPISSEMETNEGPIIRNSVVLLSTLNEFPWSQVRPKFTRMNIRVSCFIGSQQEASFVIVGTDGFSAQVIDGILVVHVFDTPLELGQLVVDASNYPIGALRIFIKIISVDALEPGHYTVTAYAESGEKKELGASETTVLKTKPSVDARMYEGLNISFLETEVTWT